MVMPMPMVMPCDKQTDVSLVGAALSRIPLSGRAAFEI